MLHKSVMELLAVWSVAQSGWKKQYFISPLFKLKISGRNFIYTFLNLLARSWDSLQKTGRGLLFLSHW
jgi:hypothetical protein